VNDRAVGSKLSNASQTTAKLWRETFGEDFRSSGCMYRGLPPKGQLLQLSKEDQLSLLKSKVATISLSTQEWSFPEASEASRTTIESIIKYKNSSKELKLPRQRIFSEVQGKFSENVWKFPQETSLEIIECNLPKIGFRLDSYWETTTCFCFPMEKLRRHKSPALLPLFPFPVEPGWKSLEFDTDIKESLKLKINFSKLCSKPVDMVFGIQPGTFYDCIMPETIQSLWGPIPLETLPVGVDNTCRAVTHSIVTGMEEKVMSVYLIHSLPLLLSAVQVFVGSKMAVVAHTVGPDTIGKEKKLELFNLCERVLHHLCPRVLPWS